LSHFYLHPFSSLKNLFLDNDSTLAADELNILKDFNCKLIVDATTQKNGQNIKILREASKMSNIDVCFGYTLNEDLYDSSVYYDIDDKLHNEIRYELTYGYDDMIPSFLGEFILSENFPNEKEQKLYRILINIVNEFNIPLFIKLNFNSFSSSSNLFEYFEKLINEVEPDPLKFNKKLLIFIISNHKLQTIEDIQQQILIKGYSIILTLYDLDLVEIKDKFLNNSTFNNENISDSKLTSYFSKEKLEYIVELIKCDNKKYVNQIMISNNINFKIHLKNYGGFGYGNLFINYYNRITNQARLSTKEIKYIFSNNLLNILSWWSPPKKEEKKRKMVTCSR
jgi:hypothetical protein